MPSHAISKVILSSIWKSAVLRATWILRMISRAQPSCSCSADSPLDPLQLKQLGATDKVVVVTFFGALRISTSAESRISSPSTITTFASF